VKEESVREMKLELYVHANRWQQSSSYLKLNEILLYEIILSTALPLARLGTHDDGSRRPESPDPRSQIWILS
jgi:hypothetical protein